MHNRFSPRLKEIISLSLEEALRLKSEAIGTGHFVLTMIKGQHDECISTWNDLNIEWTEVKKEIEANMETGNITENAPAGRVGVFSFFTKSRKSLSLTNSAEAAIRESVQEAQKAKSPVVNGEHLFLAILKNTDDRHTKILNRFGLDYPAALARFYKGILK